MSMTKEKMEFALAMGRHTNVSMRQMERILRYTQTLHRLAVQQCNGPWEDRDQAKRERVQRKIGELLNGEAAIVGIVYSNDPRGAVVKVQVKDGYTNDWGKGGIIVPSRG